jgi:TetR/AcrR family transcriptional repressor of nem operon
MRYAPDHKFETRERVLEAAARQLRKAGPQGFSLSSVMREVGLTHGGFYAHFKSKDDFVEKTVEKMFEKSPRRRYLEPDTDKPAARALGEFIDYYLSVEHRDTRVSGCPFSFLAVDAPRLTKGVQKQMGDGHVKMVRDLELVLKKLGRPEPEAEACSCISELVGAMVLARAQRDMERSNAILASSRQSLRRRFALDPSSPT